MCSSPINTGPWTARGRRQVRPVYSTLLKISTCSMKLRLSCDFLFRYWEKGFGQLQQEIRFSATWCLWDFKLVPLGFQVPYLGRITRQHREDMAQQKFKSILIMADASPKVASQQLRCGLRCFLQGDVLCSHHCSGSPTFCRRLRVTRSS